MHWPFNKTSRYNDTSGNGLHLEVIGEEPIFETDGSHEYLLMDGTFQLRRDISDGSLALSGNWTWFFAVNTHQAGTLWGYVTSSGTRSFYVWVYDDRAELSLWSALFVSCISKYVIMFKQF